MIVTNPHSGSFLQLRTCPTCSYNNNFDQILDISGSRIKPSVLAYLAAIPLRFLILAKHLAHFFLGLVLLGAIMLYAVKITSEVSAITMKADDEATNIGLATRILAIENGWALIVLTFLSILSYIWLRNNWNNIGQISTNAFPFKQLYKLIKQERRYLRCNHCGDVHQEASVVDFFPLVSSENEDGSPVFDTEPLHLKPKDNYKFYCENRKYMGPVLSMVNRRVQITGITDYQSLRDIVEDENLLRLLRELHFPAFVFAPELLWLMIYEFSESDHIRQFVIKGRIIFYANCAVKVKAVNAEINCDMDLSKALEKFYAIPILEEQKSSGRRRKAIE